MGFRELQKLLLVLKNRLLSESTPKYRRFLEWSGFNPDDPPESLLLLGVCEGIRKTNVIEVFFKPVPDSPGVFVISSSSTACYKPKTTELIANLHSGDRLTMRPESANPVDPNQSIAW